MPNERQESELPVQQWALSVLSFWFDELTPANWFHRDAAVDDAIAARFTNLYEQVSQELPVECKTSANAALAAIIVLDQFPRNMFRDTPKSFATDAMALALAETAIAQGLDTKLSPLRRQFLYMPFQHSEEKSVQARSVELFATVDDTDTLDFARRHQEIINRFGRFPHRNGVLDRATSAEEAEFLKQPGSSF